jgi:hypothetical protein
MNEEKIDCVICFEEMENDNITFPCKHSLHKQCFEAYTQHQLTHGQTSITCPLCLKEIMQVHPISTAHNSPNIIDPIRQRSKCQICCLTFFNIMFTLSLTGLLYYVIDKATNKANNKDINS